MFCFTFSLCLQYIHCAICHQCNAFTVHRCGMFKKSPFRGFILLHLKRDAFAEPVGGLLPQLCYIHPVWWYTDSLLDWYSMLLYIPIEINFVLHLYTLHACRMCFVSSLKKIHWRIISLRASCVGQPLKHWSGTPAVSHSCLTITLLQCPIHCIIICVTVVLQIVQIQLWRQGKTQVQMNQSEKE